MEGYCQIFVVTAEDREPLGAYLAIDEEIGLIRHPYDCFFRFFDSTKKFDDLRRCGHSPEQVHLYTRLFVEYPAHYSCRL